MQDQPIQILKRGIKRAQGTARIRRHIARLQPVQASRRDSRLGGVDQPRFQPLALIFPIVAHFALDYFLNGVHYFLERRSRTCHTAFMNTVHNKGD